MAASKEEFMADVQQTLMETETWLQSTLKTLNWTEENILQEEEKTCCPIDSNHILPKSCMEQHMRYCPLKKQGYTKEELDKEWEASSKFFYEKSSLVNSIEIDDATMSSILLRRGPGTSGSSQKPLPATMERAVSDLNSQEKMRIYQFCVQTSRAANKAMSIPLEDLQFLDDSGASGGDGQKSQLEMKAEARDLKRRRQSYRKKTVHTAKKTYSEVIKEVIEQQTGILSDMWRRQQNRDKREKAGPQKDRHQGEDDLDNKADKRSREDRGSSADRERPKRLRSSPLTDSDGDVDRHSRKHKHKKHKKHKKKSSGQET